jgi:hypothetical protein
MNIHEVLWARKYAEVIIECKQTLAKNPDGMRAAEGIAEGLRAARDARILSMASVVPQNDPVWQVEPIERVSQKTNSSKFRYTYK